MCRGCAAVSGMRRSAGDVLGSVGDVPRMCRSVRDVLGMCHSVRDVPGMCRGMWGMCRGCAAVSRMCRNAGDAGCARFRVDMRRCAHATG